jgi:phosphoribosylformylglycinamidine synthase
MLKAQVQVMLKKGIFDPQGQAVHNGLESVGFDAVKGVRIGKIIEIALEIDDRQKAETLVNDMCDRMLANPIVESYSYEILEA